MQRTQTHYFLTIIFFPSLSFSYPCGLVSRVSRGMITKLVGGEGVGEGVLYYELCFVCIMPGRMFSEGWLRGLSGVGRIRKGHHLTDRLWNSFKGNSCM